jgi:formylglycine-generating enzyme required for sulfatase activity
MNKRSLIVLPILLFVCFIPNSPAQSLGDIAREESARRKSIQDSKDISDRFVQPVSQDSVEMETVFVQGGTFMMGCAEKQGRNCLGVKPARSITIKGFYIGKYEVTQTQWKAVMGSDNNPSHYMGDNLPVDGVSWEAAEEFISKLNGMTGRNYRLPTEAEWEYAALGGVQSQGYTYSGSNDADAVAWHGGNSGKQPHPVGMKQPNELRLYDMSGNACEWVSGRYGEYSNTALPNPSDSESDSLHVLRGGEWVNAAWNATVKGRTGSIGTGRPSTNGLRLALSSE